MLGGIGYSFDLPLPTCLLSAGLCSIAGMFPDIDSDTSRSFQECIYLVAGIAAVLFVQRLRQLMINPDWVMLGGGTMLLFVRFGVGELVKKTTAHRGMFHSIPSAVFAGQITYFLTTGIPEERLFKAFAISVGYLSHLILDEICSVDSNGRVKKSFGTALKWFNPKKKLITLILYAMVSGMGITMFNSSNEFETMIQQELPAYSAKENNKKTESIFPVAEPLPPRISVAEEISDKDHDRHLFSQRPRRINRVPSIAVGAETAAMAPRQPLFSPESSTQKTSEQNDSTQEFPSNSVVPPSSLPSLLPFSASPLPSSPPEVFGTDFKNRGNYRNFALPNHEPATIVLP